MTDFFHRLASVMKTGLETLLAPAEDPRQVFAGVDQRQQALLARVRQALNVNAAFAERLQVRLAQLQDSLPRLEARARRALGEGYEEVARLALRQRQAALLELQSFAAVLKEIQQEEERLALFEQRLAEQIETFALRQEMIAARYNAAEAQVQIHESLSGVSGELADLDTALEQAEAKAEHMQARASAIDRLINDGVLAMPEFRALDTPFWQPDQANLAQTVEEQLAALRREIKPG